MACTCDVLMLSLLLRQLLQHNSLGDIKASVLYVKQHKPLSSFVSVAQSIATSEWIWDFCHNKMYEHVILSDLSAHMDALQIWIITTLNKEKCILKDCFVRGGSWYVTCYLIWGCVCVCCSSVKRQFDIEYKMRMQGFILANIEDVEWLCFEHPNKMSHYGSK